MKLYLQTAEECDPIILRSLKQEFTSLGGVRVLEHLSRKTGCVTWYTATHLFSTYFANGRSRMESSSFDVIEVSTAPPTSLLTSHRDFDYLDTLPPLPPSDDDSMDNSNNYLTSTPTTALVHAPPPNFEVNTNR